MASTMNVELEVWFKPDSHRGKQNEIIECVRFTLGPDRIWFFNTPASAGMHAERSIALDQIAEWKVL